MPKNQFEAEPPGEDESGEPMSLSLMGGVARPEGLPEADLDVQSLKGPGRFLSQGTAIILVIFVVAVGSLYVMSLTGREGLVSADTLEVEARIEQALAKLSAPQAMAPSDPLAANNMAALFRDTEAIVAMFTESTGGRQVPPEFIKKNPFTLAIARPVDSKARPGEVVVVREDGVLKRLQAELKDHQLQTVMHGRVPVAVISGNVVQAGGKIGSFTVVKIDAMSVELTAEGRKFTLGMQSDNQGPAGNPARRR